MEEFRANPRSPIGLACPCRLADGMTLELDLRDVSPRGCRAQAPIVALYIGQQVMLYPEGVDEVVGTVRRKYDDSYGIEFDRELPHTVFERLRMNGYVIDNGIDLPPLPEAVMPVRTVPLQAAPAMPAPVPAAQPLIPQAAAEAPARESAQSFASLTTLAPKRGGKRASGHKQMVVLQNP